MSVRELIIKTLIRILVSLMLLVNEQQRKCGNEDREIIRTAAALTG
jgi:hypothetical protein